MWQPLLTAWQCIFWQRVPYFTRSWSFPIAEKFKSNQQSVSVSSVLRSQYKFSTSAEPKATFLSASPSLFCKCHTSPFFTSVLHQHSIKTAFLKCGFFSMCQMQEWQVSNPRKWGRWIQGWILPRVISRTIFHIPLFYLVLQIQVFSPHCMSRGLPSSFHSKETKAKTTGFKIFETEFYLEH